MEEKTVEIKVEIKQLKVTQLPDSKVGVHTQFQYLVLSVPDNVPREPCSVDS